MSHLNYTQIQIMQRIQLQVVTGQMLSAQPIEEVNQFDLISVVINPNSLPAMEEIKVTQ